MRRRGEDVYEAMALRQAGEAARSAKRLLEPRVVTHRGEVVVSACVVAEPRAQLDGPAEMGERVVAGVARERGEAGVVVVQARVIRQVLERAADRFERVGIPAFAVRRHGLVVVRPRRPPVHAAICLAGRCADHEDGSVTGRLAPGPGPDEHECSRPRVDHLAVDLERHLAVEHDVELLLTRPGLVVVVDQRAVVPGRERVDSERVDPEVLAHRDVPAAPLDVVDVCDPPVRLVVHPIPPCRRALRTGYCALGAATAAVIDPTNSARAAGPPDSETSIAFDPITTPSAPAARAAVACSGAEMPKPTSSGRSVCARTRCASPVTRSERRSRAPVTPATETR